jgi:hypothetical protein
MLKTGFRLWLLVAALICLVGPVGCGGKKGSTVNGKLVLPPNLQVDKTDTGDVRLIPETRDKSGKGGATANFNGSDLTFTLKDVAPGKYKVGVTLTPYPGKENKERDATFKKINHQYDVEGGSKLTYEVTSDSEQSITIDLVAGTVTKK